jgi:hypothetical protein
VTTPSNPAARAFLDALPQRLVVAQVLVSSGKGRFELRHEDDASTPPESLQLLDFPALRAWAQNSVTGAFRPLRSAPNLRTGWRFETTSETALEQALNTLYPGFMADWFAARNIDPPITPFREFVERQTGMYRVAAHLTDPQAALTIRAGCHGRFCLKRRLWTVEGLVPDDPAEKSVIPCLEPCAVLLEFARTAARLAQQSAPGSPLSKAEIDFLIESLEAQRNQVEPEVREADFGATDNPRRIQLLIEKLRAIQQS